MSVFLSSPATIYRWGWTLTSSDVLAWGLGKLGFAPKASASEGIRARQIVLLRNLEEAAGTTTSKMIDRTNQVDRIFTRSMFNEIVMEAFGVETKLAPIDLDVMLKYLARDRQTVKFKSFNGNITPISKEDKSIASLKSLIAGLKAQMSRLEDRITTANNDALRAIRTNRRVSALAALRSKKMAENTLAQRADTLSQLENVYHSIEQASDQLVIMNVLKNSSMALKKMNEETGNMETIEDILDKLEAEVDKTNEVTKAIEERGQHDSIDESDVDDELEALLQSKINEEDERKALQTKSRLEGTSNLDAGSEDLADSLQKLKLEGTGEPTDALSQNNMQALDPITLADRNGQLQKNVSEKDTGGGEKLSIVPEAS
ncbi:MAG: hypothetical protein Q9167_000515 [Letrouitia subvulpina]